MKILLIILIWLAALPGGVTALLWRQKLVSRGIRALGLAAVWVYCLAGFAAHWGIVTGAAQTEEPSAAAEETAEEEEKDLLEVWFLDVGQADAAVIVCGEHAMMIDGGNAADSSYVYRFLADHELTELEYVIGSHADEDHIGGLAGALNYAAAGEAFCTVTERDTTAFENFVKYLTAQGVGITVPEPGEQRTLGDAELTFLWPPAGEQVDDNTSLVVRLVYGETSFLFTGDSSAEDEEALLAAGWTVECDVLKVAHHSSRTSTSEAFLTAAAPRYAILSVGADNPYGHPTQEVLDRLDAAGVTLYRTDTQGIIHCVSDGAELRFDTERDGTTSTPTDSAAFEDADYVVNLNTGRFHYPWCAGVEQMSESSRLYVQAEREDLIAKGFTPCGSCRP